MAGAEQLKQTLSGLGVTPNKALGQNFLIDETAISDIVRCAGPAGKTVLEVGPGLGALTGPLCKSAHRVVAVEKDGAMAEALRALLPDKRLTVVTEDFLTADVPALLKGEKGFLAVGNLPYYITTPISEKLLCLKPASITLMVQKEAAARYFAPPGDRVYGPMAVLSQTGYRPRLVREVTRDCFWPQPEVDSAVVQLLRRSDGPEDMGRFLSFLKRAFAMRRKTLYNNLKSEENLLPALEALGVSPGVRAEALPPETLYGIYTRL